MQYVCRWNKRAGIHIQSVSNKIHNGVIILNYLDVYIDWRKNSKTITEIFAEMFFFPTKTCIKSAHYLHSKSANKALNMMLFLFGAIVAH